MDSVGSFTQYFLCSSELTICFPHLSLGHDWYGQEQLVSRRLRNPNNWYDGSFDTIMTILLSIWIYNINLLDGRKPRFCQQTNCDVIDIQENASNQCMY